MNLNMDMLMSFAKILFTMILFSFLFIKPSFAQNKEKYLSFAQTMPQPVGGISAIYKYLTYPEAARNTHLEGKVYLLVYVDENGKVNKVTVIKGLGLGCDEAASNAIKKVNFSPGKNKGKPVKVKLAIAVSFQLSN